MINHLTRTPHDIQKVVVIGIHGWFPTRVLQAVVGEPTGTSWRFASQMAQAARLFFEQRYNIKLADDALTIIPLEGEGKVETRVSYLFHQLLYRDRTWIPKLKAADLVLVAMHSQGTPVSTMIVEKALKEGLIDPARQKIGMLAMAGISHGPFPTLKSSLIVKYLEADAARELFEFNNPSSTISVKYQTALDYILSKGVRVVAVASWYDQVVPLYSGIMHGFNHPNIYRAVYIEGIDYLPDFLSHLVVFALKLRNHGLSDHGLVVHLSDLLAGNVYGFGTQGHSTLYMEINTYTLAVAWVMGGRPYWSLPQNSTSTSPHKTFTQRLLAPFESFGIPGSLRNFGVKRENTTPKATAGTGSSSPEVDPVDVNHLGASEPQSSSSTSASANGARSAAASLEPPPPSTTSYSVPLSDPSLTSQQENYRSGSAPSQTSVQEPAFAPTVASTSETTTSSSSTYRPLSFQGPPPPQPPTTTTLSSTAASPPSSLASISSYLPQSLSVNVTTMINKSATTTIPTGADSSTSSSQPSSSASPSSIGGPWTTSSQASNAKTILSATTNNNNPSNIFIRRDTDMGANSRVEAAVESHQVSLGDGMAPPSISGQEETVSLSKTFGDTTTTITATVPPKQLFPTTSTTITSTTGPTAAPTFPQPPPTFPHPLQMQLSQFSAPTRLNPYYLPWIMASLLHNKDIQSHPELMGELENLLRMFEGWEPVSRAAKELKYRLEPLRSKL
ncbi:hypothetical protein HK102_011630 [Quaeritorhiza haematococci]|nr:hypothetical protein HK102_011630 [Quaeritorhiza haematococci]